MTSVSDAAKVVLLGDSGVGKTSIVQRFITGKLGDSIKPTVGAAFLTKPIVVDGRVIELRIWDTAGQEVYRGLAPMYYRSANIAVIVFDVTAHSSFESVEFWVKELKKNLKDNVVLIVCGNKIDLEEERCISKEEAKGFADKNGALYCEASATKGHGVNMVFEMAVSKMLSDMMGDSMEGKGVSLNEEKPAPKCC